MEYDKIVSVLLDRIANGDDSAMSLLKERLMVLKEVRDKVKALNDFSRSNRDFLLNSYKNSDKESKKYIIMWFGKKMYFGTYLRDFNVDIRTVIRQRFLELSKDYDNVNPKLEYVRLKQDLINRFKISVKLKREFDKMESISK